MPKYSIEGIIDMNKECAYCLEPRDVIIENKGLCTAMYGSDNICKK
jgi:hypothetical protein